MSLTALDRPHLHIAYILALCAIHFFTFLGARDFWEAENHFGEITRVMLLERNYWITRLNGSLWADSPPFYFWLTALFSWAIGAVNEWTVRLPSAISATVLVAAFYLFSRKWFGARVAFIASVVLATAALTIHVERHIPLNSTFYLWLTISMFCFMDVVVSDSVRSLSPYGGWFFLGLACLTKAPIAVVLPGVVIISHLVFTRRWEKLSQLRPLSGLVLFLLIVFPWFYFVIWKTSGNWVDQFLAQHHIWRNMQHGPPWYYSIVYFPIGFLPWAFLLPPAFLSIRSALNRRGDARLLFLSIWWLTALILAQLFDGHHNHYLFVALPPASLVLGIFLDKLERGGESARTVAWTRVSLTVACVVLILCALAAPLIVWDQLPEVKWHMVIFAVIGLAGAAWIVNPLRRGNYLGVVARFALLLVVVDLQIQGFIFPVLNRLETRPLAETLGAVAKPGDGVAIYQTEPLRNYFNFYSRINSIEHIGSRAELLKYLSQPGPRFVLVKERRIERLKKRINENMLIVSNHQPNAKGWFAASFPRWALVYWCTANCPSAPPVEPPMRSSG